VLGADVTADLEAMTAAWSPEAGMELCERACQLASCGVPPAAALLIAVGVLADE
jgi:hypothetical protein